MTTLYILTIREYEDSERYKTQKIGYDELLSVSTTTSYDLKEIEEILEDKQIYHLENTMCCYEDRGMMDEIGCFYKFNSKGYLKRANGSPINIPQFLFKGILVKHVLEWELLELNENEMRKKKNPRKVRIITDVGSYLNACINSKMVGGEIDYYSDSSVDYDVLFDELPSSSSSEHSYTDICEYSDLDEDEYSFDSDWN